MIYFRVLKYKALTGGNPANLANDLRVTQIYDRNVRQVLNNARLTNFIINSIYFRD